LRAKDACLRRGTASATAGFPTRAQATKSLYLLPRAVRASRLPVDVCQRYVSRYKAQLGPVSIVSSGTSELTNANETVEQKTIDRQTWTGTKI